MKVVQMGLKLHVCASVCRDLAVSIGSTLAAAPGLRAKLLFVNAEAAIAGAICIFEDEISRDDFLAGPALLQLREAPFHRGVEIRLFDLVPAAAPGPGEETTQPPPPWEPT